jgi:adenosylmethionine-8-amino-7-oxononanoate aminotransferase
VTALVDLSAPPDTTRPTDHLWMHFTRMGSFADQPVPTVERGEGNYVYDTQGRRYLDALSGLFVVQAGYGQTKIIEAVERSLRTLAYFPLWSYATPAAVELADRLAALAPGDLGKVFFTTGGSEAVETAWKLAKQYFKMIGKPSKTKVISRNVAYHGTTQGALSITGLPDFKHAFEPLVPGSVRVPHTDFYHAPDHLTADEKAFGLWAANRIEEAIVAEGPDSVAAVFVEPVQNAGGSIPPPPGYFDRVREICDEHDVLLVSDEVICAYGRLGTMFGADKFGYTPDIITSAKGLTSGYVPLGAVIISDRIFEPFSTGTATFPHGYTFGGHPAACAAGLANLDLFESDDLLGHVQRNEEALRRTLEKLYDLPIVGDVRGSGYFWSVELVRDQASKEPFSRDDCERVLRGSIAPGMWNAGVYCRADDRGQAVVQFAPTLTSGQAEFDEIEAALRSVLTAACTKL